MLVILGFIWLIITGSLKVFGATTISWYAVILPLPISFIVTYILMVIMNYMWSGEWRWK